MRKLSPRTKKSLRIVEKMENNLTVTKEDWWKSIGGRVPSMGTPERYKYNQDSCNTIYATNKQLAKKNKPYRLLGWERGVIKKSADDQLVTDDSVSRLEREAQQRRTNLRIFEEYQGLPDLSGDDKYLLDEIVKMENSTRDNVLAAIELLQIEDNKKEQLREAVFIA